MTATIGNLPWADVLAQARGLDGRGGAPVPPDAAALSDLAVSGPAEIVAVTRELARETGSALMSSGGTTGKPKLTYVPYHQAVDRVLREWRPLRPDNVLLNLFNPGRLWASHYYIHALAERSRCTVLPSGAYAPEDVGNWVPMFREIGLDALTGTPSALADFAEGLIAANETLPIRTIIWLAEPWTDAKHRVVQKAFPEAEYWANYGSVETYIIATNTPACDLQTLHVMPDQMLELEEEGALLTRRGTGWTMPAVRYRLGDRLASAECRCGRPDGLRVLGRADDAVSLRSALFSVGEVVSSARTLPGVEEAQLVLTRDTESPRAATALTLEYSGGADAEDVLAHLTAQFYHLAAVHRQVPGAITARRVDKVSRVERTNKVPPAIWRQ
ncbi:AMP-binding protein [Micromonospora sp. NPDC049460]|uniref:AMP-binding protein n=1 Tax=unclassified Micromonospora TaxID=2617518 RepID=UPI00371AC094